jgi:hypothetical protein
VVRIPLNGLPIMPNEVAWFENALACLAGTGLSEARKASVITLLAGYVRNLATTEADIEAAIRASGLTRFIAAGVFEVDDGPGRRVRLRPGPHPGWRGGPDRGPAHPAHVKWLTIVRGIVMVVD